MRRIIQEESEPFMPAWDDWGKLFQDGLKSVGAGLIYSLPIFVLIFVGYGAFFASAFLGAAVSGGEESTAAGLFPLFGILGFVVTLGLVMILSLALILFLPVVIGHIVATDEFSAAFRWR